MAYVDPTGHSWLSKYWQTAASIVTTVVSILAPPLAPAMMAINFAISAYTAVQTGNVLGLTGGIIGGAVFGAIGKSIAGNLITANIGDLAYKFAGGAIEGAVEFGISGFGAGFGAALASGENFKDSLRAGGVGAAIGAATGSIIQGSYKAGWQNSLHGISIPESVGLQAKTGTYGESYFNNLGETLSRRRNAYGVYKHYGYAEESASFKGGMRPASFGTTDVYSTGQEAQQMLSLPIHKPGDLPPNAFYAITVDLTKTKVIAFPGPVPSKTYSGFGMTATRSGGGSQVFFPTGTPPGSVGEPEEIPMY